MKIKQLVTSLVFGLGLILSLLWLMTGRSILPVYADTYDATNTNSSGAGSLHQAIPDSNTKAGSDINFSNINTGVLGVDIQSTQQAFTTTWATERIDFSKTFGRTTDRSLVLDGTNYPHIAYGGDHLYYAWYDGSTWYKETVDPAWGVGRYASIDLDSNGNPHISYYDDINHNLKYAYYDGMEWNIEVVDSDGDVGKHTSIALDALDYPHISYHDDTNGSIKYVHYDSDAWHIQMIDNTIRTDSTSLALDSSGNPHVSYGRVANPDELRYAHWTGNVWVTETVDSEVGWHSSLDLDNNDYPHIAYASNINFDNYDLMYARWTGSIWVTETVDGDANGAYPSIVLDASDNPYIAYHSSLRYARWAGAAWVTETISGESADSLSLALDTTGNPHIANYQVSSMRYIYWTGSAWNSQTVDNSRKVGESASLALAPTAPYTPHISYAAGNSLEYATYNGGRWVIETIESVEIHSAYGGGTSLALAPTVPHTIYISYGCRDGGLRYGYRTSSGWITETVDSDAYGAYRVSLALVPTAPYTLHIAYLDDGDVKYAHRTESGWEIEAVDYDTDYLWGELDGVSLAIAPIAPYTPLISYHDAGSGYVRFARRIDSEWVTETIAYSMNSSGNTSLAVDSLGNPHVAYDEWSNYYLRYAHWTGTEWDIEKIDHSGQPSLALDKNDQPRIGYYREGLLYTYRDSGAWITKTVDNLGNVGQGVSLALDGEDHPRIAYYDNSNGDLKFAWRGRVDVVPTSGGVVGAYGSADFEFPSGTFTDTVVFTYTALQPSASQSHVGVFFDISAIYASSGERAQVAPGQTYTVTAYYDEANVPPSVDEASLALYYWNEGASTWVKEPTSVVDIVNNTITATPNHFSVWAGLFEIATDIEKQVVPQGQVDYGDELTYTLIISAATGTQLGLYDPMTETNFLRFTEQPDGIDCVDNVITGTLEVPPTNQVTVSFVAQVGVPGTVGWKTDVTNRACIYPSTGTIDEDCIWSDQVINQAYHPYKIFLPLVIRNS